MTAPDAATADALATWCMVIGTEASRALIASLGEGYSCYLIYDEDGEMRTSPSPEFHLIRRSVCISTQWVSETPVRRFWLQI